MAKFFRSKTARLAGDMAKHVRRILSAQRDILAPPAIAAVEKSLAELDDALNSGATENDLQDRANDLESVANKWLKPYPNAGIRENVEVFLVALTVAMAIRTFVLQPFKIPTGSMQPTLFGVTTENLKLRPEVKVPGLLERIYEGVVLGQFYHYLEAERDCQLVGISPVKHVLFFLSTQTIDLRYAIGPNSYATNSDTFWMVPDDGRFPGDIRFGDPDHAGISAGEIFRKGQPIVNFMDKAGDHLFVDRATYNFRQPKRGEILVFETEGVGNSFAHLPPGQFYIKRMVAMGGETVSIGNDRHLVIDGKRLDKTTPHFENVYSFDPAKPPHESEYSGHLNQFIFDQTKVGQIAPLFPDQTTQYQVQPDHYMVMGDNTCNSFDSRAWGDFTRTNVIGKYFFVYWPISKRFGWNVR